MKESQKKMIADVRELFPAPREEKIAQAARASRQSFLQGEAGRSLSRAEFLIWQVSYIRKRWWIWQFLLLLFLGGAALCQKDARYAQHLLGVLGTDFVILLIPELFKNKASDSLEIEGAAFYSLRQVYAARIFAFGLVDVFLLSLFSAVAVGAAHIGPGQLLIHFFLPLTVTGCICFRALTSRWVSSELAAVLLCLLWSAAWYMTTMYLDWQAEAGTPVWIGTLVLCIGYFLYAVQRALTVREAAA